MGEPHQQRALVVKVEQDHLQVVVGEAVKEQKELQAVVGEEVHQHYYWVV